MNISSDLINNDVPAVGQLKEDECVSFRIDPQADVKIAFLGNSITRHGVNRELGWYGDWGMAASSKENDYVHKLVALIERTGKRVSYCIANLSEWEQTWNDALLKERYSDVKAFTPDVVIVRLGENARLSDREKQFLPHYSAMVDLFAAASAKVVLSGLFWRYKPFDALLQKLAADKGYAYVALDDLGERDDMKAVGLFSHEGVAAHPSDRGMAEIARRIFAVIEHSI